MSLFKKKTKEEYIKNELLAIWKEHAKQIEELYSENLIESIHEDGLITTDSFNEKEHHQIVTKFFILNFILARFCLLIDLKELVQMGYNSDRVMNYAEEYLEMLGLNEE